MRAGPRRQRRRRWLAIGWALGWVVASGCASPGPGQRGAYVPEAFEPAELGDAAADLIRLAPVVSAEGLERSYNRIGALTLRTSGDGLDAVVDPDRPVLYAERRVDRIADRAIVQLVYRVHFERIPLRASPWFFEAHRNVGLLFLISVDAASGQVLAFTTTHTCGCYRVVIPTRDFPDAWLPADWPRDRQDVYGSSLPARLPRVMPGQRLVVKLERDRHRVVDVTLHSAHESGERLVLSLEPMARLRDQPVEGAPGRRGSVFYADGPLRGHVRGAWNAVEGLTLGWLALDFSVGMDKDFGPPEQTGTPFYTMLRFWKQEDSRLDRFDVLLRELGFRLP